MQLRVPSMLLHQIIRESEGLMHLWESSFQHLRYQPMSYLTQPMQSVLLGAMRHVPYVRSLGRKLLSTMMSRIVGQTPTASATEKAHMTKDCWSALELGELSQN